jgi:intracellular sulfur oxidation DsrE/DsrF family protein
VKNAIRFGLPLALSLMLGLGGPTAQAGEKPFADRHVVLQISEQEPSRQALVLNVANNLIKHYGPDQVEVELVTFGPGIKLLLADNENRDRVAGLAASGVRFSACENSLRNLTKSLGAEPPLHQAAGRVPAGVVRIVDLVADGYTLIRP